MRLGMLALTVVSALGLAFAAAGAAAAADDVIAGDLTISGAWARATPPGAPTAGAYLTISNRGSSDDTLVAVASPAAASSELHQMAMNNGVMTMRALPDGIVIPAGQSVSLTPDGYHVMLVSLAAPLKVGTTVPLTLTFAHAGSVEVNLPVLPIGSKGPKPDAGMGGMKGM